MAIRIITDSASDIVDFPNPNLTVLPMTVAFGNTVYHDGVDLTHERFYDLLVESDELPSTGAVSPGVFAQAYDEAQAAGEDVVVVTLSSKVSATWQSARIAAEGRDGVQAFPRRTSRHGLSGRARGCTCSPCWTPWSTCAEAGALGLRPRRRARCLR